MSSLRQIRKRLQATANVSEITKAMEMSAAARLKKAQKRAEGSRPYRRLMREILDKVASASPDFEHPLMTKRAVQRTLLVVVTSDRGLCGPYNSNILKAVEQFLSDHSPESIELILVGSNGCDHFRDTQWTVEKGMTDWLGKESFADVRHLTHEIAWGYLHKKYDAAWLAYTHYETLFSNTPRVEQLLPILPPEPVEGSPAYNYLFEPSAPLIYAELLETYLNVKMQSIFFESYASELASRLVAMRAATKNAEEMIDSLTLLRNKVRQAGITREMIEIATGVESLKHID